MAALHQRPSRPQPSRRRGLVSPQMAVTPTGSSGDAPDVAAVLCGLAALGYEGIASAVRVVREQTGLEDAELAIQVGLPPAALVLWEQGSFFPAHPPSPPARRAARRPPAGSPLSPTSRPGIPL